jgi:uncharacterized membrane protein (UPF0127 family)
MNKSITILITLLLVIGLLFVFYSALTHHSEVILGGKTFIVDVANTKYSLEKGLSGREPLSDDQGMLFIFPTEDEYGFWMKDMKFPIDIIWINSQMKIVHIEKSVSPNTYPKILTPTAPAIYVLEISAGQSDLLNIKIGDSVIFTK